MFIASKYEDVIPLLMKTIINKIGHNKFNQTQIEEKEIEILKVLSFKIGVPTIKEFIDRFIEDNKEQLPKSENFKDLCIFMGKAVCHNPEFAE